MNSDGHSVNSRRPPRFRRPLLNIAATWILLQSCLSGLPAIAQEKNEPLSYSQLLEKVEQGDVINIELDPSTGMAKVGMRGEEDPVKIKLFDENPELVAKLREKNIEVDVQPSGDPSATLGLIANLALLFILFVIVIMILRRSAASSGQALNFGKSRARFQMEAKTGIMFTDVAGIDEAKEELQEVVSFLKETERFTSIGARIPKGVLLIGPPGTGKTLLAKAVAGEAGVPFFSISGSEFVEMFVGVGASRVRDLFRKAKENAPCLIFIDEIDAVGRQRGAGIGGGNDEREQTLNQLLTEMDGFEGNTGIIVIAATNRADVLDSALLRPGRFDRQVTVDLPGYKGRLGILEVHAKTKKVSSEVSLEQIARKTPGLSGADLANLLNEAAILTARRRKEEITSLEIDDAIDRVTIGMTLNPLLDGKKKRLLAYHEVGHALLMTLLEHSFPLNKVTIIPRSGGIGGFAQYLPDEDALDSGLVSRAFLLDRIAVALGGRAAEQEVFGDAEVTNGAMGDVRMVANTAREMVTRLGMSDLGPLALESSHNEGFWQQQAEYSEEIAARIDRAVRTLALEGYAKAREVIRLHRPIVDRLVDLLIDKETIEGDEFRKIVASYVKLPEKQRELSLTKS